MARRKVMVAMSGGVDSSVSAYLLRDRGFDVAGVTMCLGLPDAADNVENVKCCGPVAINDAREVCDTLGIPHYVLDFSGEMQEYVVKDFISEYEQGRTPNPCVRCNRYLKFGKLLACAKAMGFELLATGHYAKVRKKGTKLFLARPKDRNKDQTYFLYVMERTAVEGVLFPLQDLLKEDVRQIATENGLSVAEKKQSQDLCFIKKGGHREFLSDVLKDLSPGDVIDLQGNVLSQHQGMAGFTRGQRAGLGVATGKPVYVVSLDREKNTITVGEDQDLFTRRFLTGKMNILVDRIPERVGVQIRYNARSVPCRVDVGRNGEAEVTLEEPQRAVTPGQSAVFYKDDIVCGGAVIEKVLT